jgi:hypothetical protein
MNGSDKPWDDMHHRSYFLPDLERIKQDDFRSTLSKVVGHAIVPLDTHGIYVFFLPSRSTPLVPLVRLKM